MVKTLDTTAGDSLRRITIDFTTPSFKDATIADFVTRRSLHFFHALNIPTEFLQTDPSEWEARADFQKAADFVLSMKVVNDNAERAVALTQSYKNLLTKNEDQKQ